MPLQDVLNYIDEHFDDTVAELVGFCSQPSVSADGRGMGEMASLVESALRAAGGRTRRFGTATNYPLVLAEFEGKGQAMLVFYNHYDVQPPEPMERWSSDPFNPTVVDGKIYARGTADNKGSLVARIAALKAYLAVEGRPPINVTYVAEGEEESGSKYFRAFVAEHPEYFAADGVIWEEASADQNGVPVMRLGNKGMLHVELSAIGPTNDIHSRFGGIFPNPVWRLVWAAASIRSPDGSNKIEGFMDDVVAPTDWEERIYQGLAPGSTRLLERHGLNGSFPSMSDLDVMRTLYHYPTTNISGVSGGYAGPGSKTIIPGEAKLRMDFRLVPDQRPEKILELLRRHLDNNGFEDVEIRTLNTHTPVKTPLSDPFAQLVAEAGEQIFGRSITVEPTSSGTGPRHVVSAVSSVPIVAIGASYAGSMIHGPNENIRLDDLKGHAKHVAAIMDAMAREENA